MLRKTRLAAACAAFAAAQAAFAGTEPFFVPLTASAAVTAPNSTEELTAPWVAPDGVTQTLLTSMAEIEADPAQSVVRVPGLGSGAAMFDMMAFDTTGENLFIPHETAVGAGVTRYNLASDTATVLFRGNGNGLSNDWSRDWGAFDPATWTPNGTLLLGEEWSGLGRVIELLNPLTAKVSGEATRRRELARIPNVSHEGLRFSENGRWLYFVDEDNSGSIYRMRLRVPGNLKAGGQVFVLKVTGFAGDASKTWDDVSNAGQPRTGVAEWVPMTDATGTALTTTDPFQNLPVSSPRPGRVAADELGGTPFGRPEDIEIGRLANGKEVLYVATTSERAVYSVVVGPNTPARVKLFLSESVTPKNAGFDATTGTIDSPDNLAQDADGNIYVIEDAPNSSSTGGDVWFARDVDNDGEAESVDHFLSLRVNGSEGTGMIFSPVNPAEFVIAVQHPTSTDLGTVPGGHGDAVWKFNISGAVAP